MRRLFVSQLAADPDRRKVIGASERAFVETELCGQAWAEEIPPLNGIPSRVAAAASPIPAHPAAKGPK
jgi:hypothetical protein